MFLSIWLKQCSCCGFSKKPRDLACDLFYVEGGQIASGDVYGTLVAY